MRLSEVLGKAPDPSSYQVETFIRKSKIRWGQHEQIEIGKVGRNYLCPVCREWRTYYSGLKLSCLVTGDTSVSIDVTLKCSGCEQCTVDAWFLVETEDHLLTPSPLVTVKRFSESRRSTDIELEVDDRDSIEDLFDRAQAAYQEELGAGAMIYLRKIFESVTEQTALAMNIPTKTKNHRRKPFKQVLQAVDDEAHIIPQEFNRPGYRLFEELSDVIHGESSEADALAKYNPCRRLVSGIVNNIRTNQAVAEAIAELEWHKDAPLMPIEGEQP